MTIQNLADNYAGHPQEIDEDFSITLMRDSYKEGALRIVKEIEDILKDFPLSSLLVKIDDKLKELKENAPDNI